MHALLLTVKRKYALPAMASFIFLGGLPSALELNVLVNQVGLRALCGLLYGVFL